MCDSTLKASGSASLQECDPMHRKGLKVVQKKCVQKNCTKENFILLNGVSPIKFFFHI